MTGQPVELAIRATRSSAWTLASQILQTCLGALSFGLLAKWLGPTEYGLVAMAATATGLVGSVGDAGMVAAVIREKVIDAEVESTASWIAYAVGAALCAATALAAPGLGAFYKNPSVVPLAIALSLTFVINAPAYVSRAKLSKQLDFRKLAIASAVGSLVALCGAYAVARHGGGAWSLVTNLLLGIFVPAVLVNVWARPNMRPARFSRTRAKELGRFSRHVSTFSLAIIIGRTADSVLTGRYLGGAALGTMSTAMLLIGVPVTRVSTSISGVFLPTLLELPSSEARGRAFASVAEVMTFLLAPVCLGAFAVAPELLALFPNRWHGVAPALQIASIGLLLEPVGYLCCAVLSAQGRVSLLSRFGIFLLPFSWAGAIIGVSLGSVTYVLIGWAVVNLTGGIILIALVWRSLHLGPWFVKSVLVPMIGSVLMATAVRLLFLTLPEVALTARVGSGIVVGVATYLAFAALFLREPTRKLLSLVQRSARG